MRLLRLLAATLVAVGVALVGAPPTGAIETTSFGIDVVDASDDQRLHIGLMAGATTEGRLRVWNKTDAPLRLAFSVIPASVDASGTARLEGEAEPVRWVDVLPPRLDLAPRASRIVEVRVRAPRRLDERTRTVAVLAQPDAAPGDEPPAVLQRLAMTTFLEPDRESLIASLGPFPWIGAAVLVVVVAALARRALRRNDQ